MIPKGNTREELKKRRENESLKTKILRLEADADGLREYIRDVRKERDEYRSEVIEGVGSLWFWRGMTLASLLCVLMHIISTKL